MISFDEAYRLTLEHIQPLHVETVDLLAAAGRIAGQDFLAKVDNPIIRLFSNSDSRGFISCPESRTQDCVWYLR